MEERPVSNYRNGGDLERAAKKHLETEGYYVVKSAGSKGLADLVALKRGETLLIQCKTRGTMTRAARMALRMLALRVGATPLLCSWYKEGSAARVPSFGELVAAGLLPWTADRAFALADARLNAIADGGL